MTDSRRKGRDSEREGTITGYRHSATCLCGCHLVVGAKGRRREDDDTPRLAAMGGAVYEFPASTDRGPVDVYYERPKENE